METEADVDQYYETIPDDTVESSNRYYEGLQMNRATEHRYEKLEANPTKTEWPRYTDMPEKATKKNERGQRTSSERPARFDKPSHKKSQANSKRDKKAEGVHQSPTTCSISLPWWGWLGVLLGIILLCVLVILAVLFVTGKHKNMFYCQLRCWWKLQ